jgi:hypothetical protein
MPLPNSRAGTTDLLAGAITAQAMRSPLLPLGSVLLSSGWACTTSALPSLSRSSAMDAPVTVSVSLREPSAATVTLGRSPLCAPAGFPVMRKAARNPASWCRSYSSANPGFGGTTVMKEWRSSIRVAVGTSSASPSLTREPAESYTEGGKNVPPSAIGDFGFLICDCFAIGDLRILIGLRNRESRIASSSEIRRQAANGRAIENHKSSIAKQSRIKDQKSPVDLSPPLTGHFFAH